MSKGTNVSCVCNKKLQWKKQGKGRKVDMCKAIDDMLEDSRNDGLRIGREEGREKGIIEGEERISKLGLLIC